jgi:pimeloyl-ACP methyl ester carboxylesterase
MLLAERVRMQFIEQNEFEQPNASSLINDEPLIVHRRPQITNASITIFVHGLGGSRYETWADFPKFLYADLPSCDIGLYSYRTLWRRIGSGHSTDLEAEAAILAHIVRDFSYNKVVLMGHSLGGILVRVFGGICG